MHSDDPTPHLERFDSYEQACREFSWLIPKRFNIAGAICRRHRDAVTRMALNEVKEAGNNSYTFGGLDFLSDKFATSLSESGVEQGDSVAVILAQSAALAVAQLGVLKLGAVVVPLSISSDQEALKHALADSNAKAVVIDESIQATAALFGPKLFGPDQLFVVRDLRLRSSITNHRDFWSEVDRASSDFETLETDARSPAFIFYAESKGKPIGVVHSHTSLIGQLTAFEMCSNLEPDARSVFYPASDWSSPSAVLGMLYPAWWYGCSVVALNDWAGRALGVTNQVYGKPETGCIAGSGRWFPTRDDSVGRAAPGHSIEIIDEDGNILSPGETGRLAVHKSDPALFSEYHNAPERTAASFCGDWFLTGDVGFKNEAGDLYIGC